MSDFPAARFHKPVISSHSIESLGGALRANSVSVPASASWPATSRAIYVPFTIAAPYLVQKFWWANGSAVAGNCDCGIYTADGTLIANTGATAQAGTTTIQSVALGTPLLLLPASYYMALANSSTGNVFRSSPAVAACQMFGMAQQASAEPLPATATFATIATAYLPLFGIASATVI